jgi:hypothetical protein
VFNLNNLQIKPSPLLIVITLIIFGSGMLVLYHTNLSPYIYIGMSITGLIITLSFIAKYALLVCPTSIVRCDATEGSLYLTQKNDRRIEATPLSSTYLSPKLLLLAWKPVTQQDAGRLFRIKSKLTFSHLTIFTTENVTSKEDFRRLRVLLKFGKLNAVLKPHS